MKTVIGIFFLLILGVSMYILTIRGVAGNPDAYRTKNDQLAFPTKPFELSSERGRYLLTYSLAEHQSFALSQELAELAMPDVAYYRNKFYIYFAPGISLLALPAYELGKTFGLSQVLSFSVIALFAVFNLIVIFLICRMIFKLPLWASLVAPLIFGFATTSWSYAITLYQHEVTTFFLLSSFFAIWMYKKQSRLAWLWGILVWFNFAYALMIDYPNVIFMLPIIAYFFISSIIVQQDNQIIKITFRMAFIVTAAVFVLVSAIHGYINYSNFGDWKRINGSLPSYKGYLESIQTNQTEHFQMAQQISQASAVSKFFLEERLLRGFYTLTVADDKGLFLFSPVLLLGVLGVVKACKHFSIEHGVLLAIGVVNLVLYASWNDPWGGWAFGPRYLLPTMAVLAIFIAVWLSSITYRILGATITFLLCMYSVAVALLGALTTNSVPPKSEAVVLHAKYGFLAVVDYLKQGKSGSFFYNTYALHTVSLLEYAYLIFVCVSLIIFFLLFVLPVFERYENHA